MASTPTMLTGYTNLAITDTNTTTVAEGDGASSFLYDGAVIYHLTRALLLAGATVTSSSTRTSGTGSSANTLSATDQWSAVAACAYIKSHWACKITLGGVQFNLSFQVGGTTVGGVRVKASVGAGNEFSNSGGSVSATRVKAITGELLFTPETSAAGTDASPIFAPLPVTGAGCIINACWDATTGYFFFEMHPAAGGTKGSAGFVFAILPFDTNTFVSTRSDRVFLISPGTLLDAANFTETSTYARVIYRCRQGISGTALAAVKPQYRGGIETMAVDPGTSDKTNLTVSFKRDASPVDTGGLAPDILVLGQVIAAPTMHDVKINPNSATKNRYLCLGNMALRVPNTLVSS